MTSAGRSTSTSRANLARLPSLKQLSDRLGPKENEKVEKEVDAKEEERKEREKQKPALSEITTITTNVPIAAPTPVVGSRLKLPASAVARANLSPDGTRTKKEGQVHKSSTEKAEATAAAQDTKSQLQGKVVSSKAEEASAASLKATDHSAANGANGADKSEQPGELSPAAEDATNKVASNENESKGDTQVKDDQGKPDVHRTVRALGMGRPGMPSTPPSRKDSVVPDIVVQSSTPGKSEVSEETEKRVAAALAAGQHPLAHSW